MIASEKDAYPADADGYPQDLGPVVADVQEDKGDDDDEDDGPEVDQLRGEDGGVSVCEDGEIISFHVEEGEKEVFPAVAEEDGVDIWAEAVTVEGVARVEQVEEEVVPKRLEGRDGETLGG